MIAGNNSDSSSPQGGATSGAPASTVTATTTATATESVTETTTATATATVTDDGHAVTRDSAAVSPEADPGGKPVSGARHAGP